MISLFLEGFESFHNFDKTGFGEVMTLFSDESTISEEVPIDYENKLLSMMIIVMTCMLLRIMITMKLVIMILVLNWIMPHMIIILFSLLQRIYNL